MRLPSLLVFLLFLAPALHAAPPAPSKPKLSAQAGKPESYLLLPEPRAMRSSISKPLGEARSTVFSPAHFTARSLSTYTAAEFGKLGVGWDTFLERAEAAADRLLATHTPELIKDAAGHVQYAVYRGDEPIMACLMLAPSLPQVFKKVFGEELWLVSPDRHSLYVFPPKAEAMADFVDDLRQRYDNAPYAASEEVFLRKNGTPLQAIGSLPK